MTPFWNQTSPSNLIPASLGVIQCAREACGDEVLTWKIGLNARREIFLMGRVIAQDDIPPERLAVYRKHPHLMQFCGLYGDPQGRDFPLNRLELYSPSRGHVGTVEIVP